MIFVTGGAGYIGSHTCVELLQAGHRVAIFDNFCNSQPQAIDRIEQITGQRPTVYRGDIRNQEEVSAALQDSQASAVIHFAGLKAVGESVQDPLRYYDNNVVGTLRLLQAMGALGIKTLVFSSSATVYGEPAYLPYDEAHPLKPSNPYGHSKLMVEQMLRDLQGSDNTWRVGILRYFNPVGAHSSGLMGEDPQGIPNNLMPFVAQVAVGRRPRLSVFGNDYATPDGTGVRDYIHVVDLALGHLKALDRLRTVAECHTVNLGTGAGVSVLDMVHAFEQASARAVPYVVEPRRSGDLAAYYADPALALRLLGWSAQRTLQDMCVDTWRWQSNNPEGYTGPGPDTGHTTQLKRN